MYRLYNTTGAVGKVVLHCAAIAGADIHEVDQQKPQYRSVASMNAGPAAGAQGCAGSFRQVSLNRGPAANTGAHGDTGVVWPGDKGKQENRRTKRWSGSYNIDYFGEASHGLPEEEEQFVIRTEEDRERRDDGTGKRSEGNRNTTALAVRLTPSL